MIITKSSPYTLEEITKLREQFDTYIKTVIDVKKKICSAGCDRHFESEKILLDKGSKQKDIWGGGIDAETKAIDCNAMINARPTQGNPSEELLNEQLRQTFEDLTKYFFKVLYEK